MNVVYALLFITAGVALLALAAVALDATLASRKKVRRPTPQPTACPPPPPPTAVIHTPDLTRAGELAQHLECVRADAEAQSC